MSDVLDVLMPVSEDNSIRLRSEHRFCMLSCCSFSATHLSCRCALFCFCFVVCILCRCDFPRPCFLFYLLQSIAARIIRRGGVLIARLMQKSRAKVAIKPYPDKTGNDLVMTGSPSAVKGVQAVPRLHTMFLGTLQSSPDPTEISW